MKHYAILVAICCLTGCIHYQPNEPLKTVVMGKVTMPVRLYKTAEVNIRFYAQNNGRLLLINYSTVWIYCSLLLLLLFLKSTKLSKKFIYRQR